VNFPHVWKLELAILEIAPERQNVERPKHLIFQLVAPMLYRNILPFDHYQFPFFQWLHYLSSLVVMFINKKQFRLGEMAPSEQMRSLKAVCDTPVADYSMPGISATRCVACCPPITISPLLLPLSVS
jgi:hypothetical protein